MRQIPTREFPSSLIGTCLTLPNLGFLWVFFKYPKISKNGNPLFCPVVQAPFESCVPWDLVRDFPYRDEQGSWEGIRNKLLLPACHLCLSKLVTKSSVREMAVYSRVEWALLILVILKIA